MFKGFNFLNGSTVNMKFSKTQLPKIIQLGGFLGRILGPLLRTGLSLIGNVLKPLAKRVSKPLRLTRASATDVFQKIFFRSGMHFSDLVKQTTSFLTKKWMVSLN